MKVYAVSNSVVLDDDFEGIKTQSGKPTEHESKSEKCRTVSFDSKETFSLIPLEMLFGGNVVSAVGLIFFHWLPLIACLKVLLPSVMLFTWLFTTPCVW